MLESANETEMAGAMSWMVELHIGVHNEACWTGFHMTLQFDDVVDCLNVLCPEFDYLFLFDHSQGHARKRDGALDAKNVEQLAKDLEAAGVSLQRGKHHTKLEL